MCGYSIMPLLSKMDLQNILRNVCNSVLLLFQNKERGDNTPSNEDISTCMINQVCERTSSLEIVFFLFFFFCYDVLKVCFFFYQYFFYFYLFLHFCLGSWLSRPQYIIFYGRFPWENIGYIKYFTYFYKCIFARGSTFFPLKTGYNIFLSLV